MKELILICATCLIGFFGWLYYQSCQKYIDEPVGGGDVLNSNGRVVGNWTRYKRTYKNGRVTYFEKKYL